MNKSLLIVLTCLLCLGTLCPAQARQQPAKSNATDINWNVVILSPTKIYCYTTGPDAAETAAIQPENTFRPLLTGMKRKWGKRLRVDIKAAVTADYKTIIDVLDEMTINRIARFKMVDMTAAEEKKFGQRNRPRDTANISTSIVEEKGPAIIIRLKDSTEAGLSYMDEKGQREELADAHNNEELSAALDKAAVRTGGKDKLHVQIKGSANLPYCAFSWVVEVLRSKEFYHYQLITTPE